MMGINPQVFWECSVTEISLAVDGFSEFNGGKGEPMSKNELNDIMEMYPDN